jgi:hypothetical protein
MSVPSGGGRSRMERRREGTVGPRNSSRQE